MKTIKKEDGFTMVELMIAILIMTVGLLATFKMMSSFRDATLLSRDEIYAASYATKRLEDLLGETFYYDFSNSQYVISTNLSNGSHSDTTLFMNKYSVSWVCISPTSNTYSAANNLIDITITVSWQYHGKSKSLSFRTLKSAS